MSGPATDACALRRRATTKAPSAFECAPQRLVHVAGRRRPQPACPKSCRSHGRRGDRLAARWGCRHQRGAARTRGGDRALRPVGKSPGVPRDLRRAPVHRVPRRQNDQPASAVGEQASEPFRDRWRAGGLPRAEIVLRRKRSGTCAWAGRRCAPGCQSDSAACWALSKKPSASGSGASASGRSCPCAIARASLPPARGAAR